MVVRTMMMKMVNSMNMVKTDVDGNNGDKYDDDGSDDDIICLLLAFAQQ